MVTGVSHLTFLVKDLEAASRFFQHIFDAEPVYDSGDRQFSLSRERFFLAGGIWVCIMEGEPLPSRSYNHTAFRIPEEEFGQYADRVRTLGVDVLPGRPRVEGEGRSLYFFDYDNHLFELHTGSLERRLERYSI